MQPLRLEFRVSGFLPHLLYILYHHMHVYASTRWKSARSRHLALVAPSYHQGSCSLCISSSMNREQHIYGDLLLLPFLFFLGVALDPLPAWIGFFTTAVSLSSSSSANICSLVCLTTFGAPAL